VLVVIGYAATAFADRGNLEKINDAIRAMRFSEVRWLFWGVTLLILFNSVMDFRYNWQLYFPDQKQKISSFSFSHSATKRIFLAAPFTQLLQRESDSQNIGNYRAVLESIIELFDANNIEVFNAHKREAWGENLQPPAKALGYDLDEIARSDLLVMIIGSPPSPGVQLELGYAIALNKPIVLLSKKDDFVPYLVRGLAEAVTVKEIKYRREDEIADLLKTEFRLH
jgi:nucleoside 2-deoxyribosyltransferase